MKNRPGQGPTRQDHTLERMAQERASPGATSAGGHSADAPADDAGQATGPASADGKAKAPAKAPSRPPADKPSKAASKTAAKSASKALPKTSTASSARRGDVAATAVEPPPTTPPERPKAAARPRRHAAAKEVEATSLDAGGAATSPQSSNEIPTNAPVKTREERIREAAYRIFESRRHEGGDETDDWLRAEAEVDAADREQQEASGTSP